MGDLTAQKLRGKIKGVKRSLSRKKRKKNISLARDRDASDIQRSEPGSQPASG
jgi:hypothetical protein